MDYAPGKFSVFFLGYKPSSEIPKDDHEQKRFALLSFPTIEATQ